MGLSEGESLETDNVPLGLNEVPDEVPMGANNIPLDTSVTQTDEVLVGLSEGEPLETNDVPLGLNKVPDEVPMGANNIPLDTSITQTDEVPVGLSEEAPVETDDIPPGPNEASPEQNEERPPKRRQLALDTAPPNRLRYKTCPLCQEQVLRGKQHLRKHNLSAAEREHYNKVMKATSTSRRSADKATTRGMPSIPEGDIRDIDVSLLKR